MFFIKKKVVVPEQKNATLEAAKTWRVTWHSRYGDFTHELKKEVEFFFSAEDANTFADALKNAFSLLRYKATNKVTVEENK